jgi:antitoxin Phd
MLTLDAREAKQGFGRLLDEARRAPVAINKHGRKIAVMMAAEDYDRLEELYDWYWGKKAEEAEKEGFLGVEESAAILGISHDENPSFAARRKNSAKASSKNSPASARKNRAARARRARKR